MRKEMLAVVVMFALGASGAEAQTTKAKAAGGSSKAAMQSRIRDAMSAAPADIARGAMIMDWPDQPGGQMKHLRDGSNGWTCMPTTPSQFKKASAKDPMCLDKTFSEWADAWMSKKDPLVKTTGVAYMLRGDKGASNTDPFATGPTPANQWVVSPPHVMVVVPDPLSLDSFPTDPNNGGPWVMWKGTKYAHLMVPITPIKKAASAPRR